MAERRPKMPRPAPVGDLLSAVFHGTPAERRLRETVIWKVWNGAVGKQIAGRAQPVAIREGVLTVVVSSAPWMQQLTFLKKGIIEKLNTAIGEPLVREIHLKAGRPDVPEPPAKEAPPRRTLSDAERLLIREQAAAVSDPELREAFVRLLETYHSEKPAS